MRPGPILNSNIFRCEKPLSITHSLLVLQLELILINSHESSFGLEIVILDKQKHRRRLHFSTHFSHFNNAKINNVLHAKVPWESKYGANWSNVVCCLNLSVVSEDSYAV